MKRVLGLSDVLEGVRRRIHRRASRRGIEREAIVMLIDANLRFGVAIGFGVGIGDDWSR